MVNTIHRSIFQIIALFCFLLPTIANAQVVLQLMAARNYHEMKPGPEKIERIQELERKGWYHKDDLMDHNGNAVESKKIDLAPFVDSLGTSVFFVTEISPEFPGGSDSLDDYLQNQLGDLLVQPNGTTQNTLFVQFTVLNDGKIESVAPANPFPEWVPTSTGQRCLATVREMPIWSPGIFKDRPVKVKMMMVFSLRD